jgi:hypothetical protein
MATQALKDADGLPILKPRTPPYIRGGNAPSLPKPPKPIVETTEPKTINEVKLKALELLKNRTGLNIDDVIVSDKMTLEQLNKYINQLDKLTNEYNVSNEWSKLNSVKLKFQSSGSYNGNIEYSNNAKEVYSINFGNRFDLNARNFDLNSDSYRPKSRVDFQNRELSTLTHEFGHFITVKDQAYLSENLKSFWGEIDKAKRAYKSKLKNLVTGANRSSLPDIQKFYLGDYAQTNSNEFMAEAFTEYKLSSNPSEYALIVGKIIDKYFKK